MDGFEQEKDIDERAFVVAFGRELAAERARAGYSLRKLADRAGLALMTLHRVEHAQREIKLGDLKRVASALGVSPSAMLDSATEHAKHAH
jgi:transcriptional regulator with XRE-family HTH domain